MKIQPLGDRLLLEPVEPESVTKSGIYLPDSKNKERPHMYTVIAVWPGKMVDGKLQKIEDIKPGDKVLKGQYSGDEIKVDNTTYHIVGVEYILAKVA